MGIPDHRTCLLRKLYSGQETTVRTVAGTRNGTKTGFKLVKEYIKACHPACLTYTQSTSYKMLGWMTHKRESRLLGEIPTTSDIYADLSEEEIKSLLMKVKEESEKAGLKLNI